MAVTRLGAAAFGLLLGASACTASAGQIAAGSTFSIDGVDSYTTTTVNFHGPGNAQVADGSFAAFGTCFSCVFENDFKFNPFGSNTQIYGAFHGLEHTAFYLQTVDSFTFGPGNKTLTILGSGEADLTGFDPTPAAFAFSTQGGLAHNTTFSATIGGTPSPVPEPSSLMLLGIGLVGMGMVYKLGRV